MNRTTEIQLAEELLALHRGKSAFLADAVTTAPVEAYTDTRRFRRERAKIMRTALHPAVHAGELPERGSFLRRDVAGLPVLFTRDGDGGVHAFLNVCRHRGTRLVDEERGCKRRFSCPYHAWTYSNRGELLGLPHEKQGFPDADRDSLGLKRLGCVEKYGWLWVTAATDESPDVEGRLAGLAGSLDWLGADNYRIVHSDEILCSANWKLLVEGGIEAYHFRVAHRKTIGPYFLDNLSTYRCFGPHMRSVLAKRSLPELAEQPVESWRLLDHAQVLLSVFPLNQFLVQSDHFAWIQMEPLDAGSTRIRLHTLAPTNRLTTKDDLEHWSRNHAITLNTLTEDFDLGESIQVGLESGANDCLTFGRFEGALSDFNGFVDAALQDPAATG